MMALREMEEQDEELLVEYLNDERVVKYLSSRLPTPYTAADAKWWVNRGSKEDAIVRAIEYNGKFCGVTGVSFQPFEYCKSAEIGYWVAYQYWGKGIATKALLELTEYVLLNTPIVRLYAPVFSPNSASMRVLEKSGYCLEGILEKAIFKNGRYFNKHLFARIKP